ncbi:MAG TPA: T9SS type A sorting domain-containing protein, partial [Bacteroidota bacterium]|nr:T9SS type A sorting domain-containing protein [Bacteroidota bacterium]
GYWLKHSDTTVYSFPGRVLEQDTFEVQKSWNMIGSISYAIPTSMISSIPGGIVTSQFFGYQHNGYYIADTIDPGKAYWVKAGEDGALIISHSVVSGSSSRVRIIPDGEFPPAPPGTESDDSKRIPARFSLSQNYPNPFNPETHIRFSVPRNSFVTLKILDLLGREIATLFDAPATPGEHTVHWNAEGYGTGVYFYRLRTSDYSETKKLLLLR